MHHRMRIDIGKSDLSSRRRQAMVLDSYFQIKSKFTLRKVAAPEEWYSFKGTRISFYQYTVVALRTRVPIFVRSTFLNFM